MSKMVKKTETTKPQNAVAYEKAITLGKTLSKKPEMTKAEISRQMYELLKAEERDVIAAAFVEGANLTPKGAVTYVYNCRRACNKAS